MSIIKEMGLEYRLIINPYATFDKEMILLYSGQVTDSSVEISKFYELPSLRPINYSEEIRKNVNLKVMPLISNFENPVVNFKEIFSEYDLFYLIKAIKESDSIGMFKVLPYNMQECSFK